MVASAIDIHPHIISDDEHRYPLAPLFGQRLAWSEGGHATAEHLIRQMDDAGVDKAAVVQSSTTYGFDNSYVLDSCDRFPDRLRAVCSIDVLAEDAVETIRALIRRGMAGLRVFTGNAADKHAVGPLLDRRAQPAFAFCAASNLPLCVYTAGAGWEALAALAARLPSLRIVLDHLGRPDLSDGSPYRAAAPLFALAACPNITVKLTTRTLDDLKRGTADAPSFLSALVKAFGARRIAWGSNRPMSPGSLAEVLARATAATVELTDEDRCWIFSRTAASLYPRLAN